MPPDRPSHKMILHSDYKNCFYNRAVWSCDLERCGVKVEMQCCLSSSTNRTCPRHTCACELPSTIFWDNIEEICLWVGRIGLHCLGRLICSFFLQSGLQSNFITVRIHLLLSEEFTHNKNSYAYFLIRSVPLLKVILKILIFSNSPVMLLFKTGVKHLLPKWKSEL